MRVVIENINATNIYCREYGGFIFIKSNTSETDL